MAVFDFSRPRTYFGFIASTLLLLIAMPFSIFVVIQFYKEYNKQYLIKRHRATIIIYLGMSLSWIFIVVPMFILRYWKIVSALVNNGTTFLMVVSFSVFGFLFFMRVYLLHFDHKYYHLISNEKWTLVLNHDANSKDRNYFIAKRGTLGNAFYISVRFLLPTILIASAIQGVIILKVVNLFVNVLMVSCIALAPVIPVLILWKKLPVLTDLFAIRKEIKTIGVMFVVFPLVSVVIMLLMLFVHQDFWGLVSILLIVTAVILQTVTILVPQAQHRRVRPSNFIGSFSSDSDKKSWERPPTPSFTTKDSRTWKPVVKTIEGYEAFIQFLMLEFSSNNLLFLTEYMQLKNLHETVEQRVEGTRIFVIPKEVPKSKIVEQCEAFIGEPEQKREQGAVELAFMQAMFSIHDKYIAEYSDFQVNISYYVNRMCRAVFGSQKEAYQREELNKAWKTMDKAAKEISDLMADSFSRFRAGHCDFQD